MTFAKIRLPKMSQDETVLFNSFLCVEKNKKGESKYCQRFMGVVFCMFLNVVLNPLGEEVFLPNYDELVKKAEQKVDKLRPFFGSIRSQDSLNNYVYEAATRISKSHYVTFQHKSHSEWEVGRTVVVHEERTKHEFEVE